MLNLAQVEELEKALEAVETANDSATGAQAEHELSLLVQEHLPALLRCARYLLPRL